MPARVFVDLTTRLYLRKGEPANAPTQHSLGSIGKNLAKDIPAAEKDEILGAIPQMMIAFVKESAKAKVTQWAADPVKAEKLATFILEHQDESLGVLTKSLEWIAEHPEDELDTALTAAQSIAANSISADFGVEKVLNLRPLEVSGF